MQYYGIVVADSILEYIKMMCAMVSADINLDDYKNLGRTDKDSR